MFTVYKVINTLNNKFYIGVHKTSNPYDTYMGSGLRIIREIKKYGVENFKKEILFSFEEKELAYLKEKEIVSHHKDNVNCLNISEGGIGGSNFAGKKHSQETKEKLANASRGRYPSLETRKKISESNRKRIITESFKEKMRKPRKPMSEETKRKISLTRHIKYGNKIHLKQVG